MVLNNALHSKKEKNTEGSLFLINLLDRVSLLQVSDVFFYHNGGA